MGNIESELEVPKITEQQDKWKGCSQEWASVGQEL